MIVLDFAPILHGHFLEYVINRYIYQCKDIENIFDSTGAAHRVLGDKKYQKDKKVMLGHFSAFGIDFPENAEKRIYIKHDPDFDFVVLTNMFHRCYPVDSSDTSVSSDDIKTFKPHTMFDHEVSIKDRRNNWYTKLLERHFSQCEIKKESMLDTFDFRLRAFFNLDEFIEELQNLSQFLNTTFVFDNSLVALWETFISKNQGLTQYHRAKHIVNCIISNISCPIDPANWQVQSYVNQRLSYLFRLYDGELFTTNDYPSNATDVHKIIIKHIQDFDSRF